MIRYSHSLAVVSTLLFALGGLLAGQPERSPKSLLAPDSKLTSSSPKVQITGQDVTIEPGDDQYPGVTLEPAKPWDLSGFGHIEAKIRNTGATPLGVSLRVDNAGDWKDNPWNAESVIISAGQTATIKTIFGYSYGLKPGFKLNPAAVTRLLLFTDKPSETVAFRVESLVADGPVGEKPPVAESDVRIKPKDGMILGPGVSVDSAKQIVSNGATVTTVGSGLKIVFSDKGGSVTIRPSAGRWDLRDFDGLLVALRGDTNIPSARMDTDGGSCVQDDVFTSRVPIKAVRRIGFAGFSPFDLASKSGGSAATTDAVRGITLTATSGGTVFVDGIVANLTVIPTSSWLGNRPPVEGKWVKTLDDEFDGATINDKIWNVKGENYYDKVSHWSKDNVLVGGGQARLRYEKKKGFQNDDPKRNETPYASGFLDTYGKWTQKYGYFEARMKLPKAPGLWPAFWMMPDRGTATGEQWQRQDTKNGGMEFDIMEHLTRWGGHRYNIAVHYDGYEKEHKSLGTDKIYCQPDKDGYLTCGLLWEPGLAVWYCNGIEVARWKDDRVSSVPSNLMFTLPSGGWDNDAVDDTKLPSDFVIDYVRVWKRG